MTKNQGTFAGWLTLIWPMVCSTLWTILFKQWCRSTVYCAVPNKPPSRTSFRSAILLLSRRGKEASQLLQRIRSVHGLLPEDLQAEVTVSNTQELTMGDIGSWSQCFHATPEQALSARRSSQCFTTEWLPHGVSRSAPLQNVLGVPSFTPIAHPGEGHQHLISVGPAEGSPDSDSSAAVLLDSGSWEQVGSIHRVYEPDIFAVNLSQLRNQYNGGVILVDRNDHSRAVLLALEYVGCGNIYLSPRTSFYSDIIYRLDSNSITDAM